MQSIYRKLTEIESRGESAALCLITETHGSTPLKAGAKMLVWQNGKIFGTIGGGNLEKKVIEDALEINKTKQPKLFRHDLLHQHNMCCGGTMEIFIEPIMKKNKLYIFGAGHTGQALAKYAVNFPFEVFLIDDRKEYIDECAIAEVNKMNLPYQQALPLLPFDETTFICIMTYSHPFDRDILAFCLKNKFAYLGMIGSQRKVKITKKMFADGLNFSEKELEKVDMPIGIGIGAEGPEEIAFSIMAKIIAVKNKKSENQNEKFEKIYAEENCDSNWCS